MSDITNINKKIGERIREKRIEKGLTLKQLGDLVGVDSSTILRYEKGEIKKIKLPVIESIAYALNVDPAWLALKSENPKITAPRSDVKKNSPYRYYSCWNSYLGGRKYRRLF